MKNNKGYSILEVLIVVAIAALLMAMTTIAYRIVYSANVEKSMNSLNAAFNKARTVSMAKGPAAGKLTLDMDSDGNLYYKIGSETQGTLICNSMQTVTYDNTFCISQTVPTAELSGSVYYTFNSDGSLKAAETTGPSRIVFSRWKNHSQVLIYSETGKHMTGKFTD